MSHIVQQGDCRQLLTDLLAESVDCAVSSPPYFKQRVYSSFFDENEIGNESDVAEYVDLLTSVFRSVRRALKPSGTLFLNLGDKYQNKKLLGVPWRVALSLIDDGWRLRNEIIWHKPNPMPSSATDRFTPAHEHVFFFVKSSKYHFDQILEPATYAGTKRGGSVNRYEQNQAGMDAKVYDFRNKRDVWSIRPASGKGHHTAVFPEELVEPCIESGCPIGGLVLDPFAGLGTTGVVAKRLNRSFVGFELNPEFAETANNRISGVALPKLELQKSHAAVKRAKATIEDEAQVDEFLGVVSEVLEAEQLAASEYNQQIDDLLGFGISLATIAKAEDPDQVTGFDEVVDAVRRSPSNYALIGNSEQTVFDALKRGRRPIPNLRSDEIWNKSLERWEAQFANS